MTQPMSIEFVSEATPAERILVVLAGQGPRLSAFAQSLDRQAGGCITRAMEAAEFKGKAKSSVELLAPSDLAMSRLIVTGAGEGSPSDQDALLLGGAVYGQISQRRATAASVSADLHGIGLRAAAEFAADVAAGALLRAYSFKKYRTAPDRDEGNGEKNGEAGNREGLQKLKVHCADPEAAAAAFGRRRAVAEGVMLARDLVNEPANVLGPVEFAERARALQEVGVEVEVLDVERLQDLKMNALLGVAQGSARPARVVVMQWHGAKSRRAKPLCFVGKGVTFDTGGISIKPAAGMEDMKGDMGGAACVTGLMHALAARRANVNAVGLIGLVENMPSGTAQRPGDIVTSMSGKTIEVLNTDAEGRLVLADVLHYAQDRFKPRLIVDLATLTGAIMVALGKEYAGLFSNDDKLAEDLIAAGEGTGEKVWRMPLAKAYDKMIDSRTADMKNIGGRHGGAITAAQFLQRFVKDTPWAHLDVAGVAMDSNKNDISQGWASGWGVRLLDRLVADKHERPER